MKKVAVIMGSDSDWPVVKGACAQLDSFGIPYEAHILSAHRTPAAAAEFARNARANGFGVLICAAGMAAHLAGAFAGNSTLPVIGIPMKGGAMDGLDALQYGNRTVMLHEGRIIIDIDRETKARLTVEDLLKMFKTASGSGLTNDRMLLSQ